MSIYRMILMMLSCIMGIALEEFLELDPHSGLKVRISQPVPLFPNFVVQY